VSGHQLLPAHHGIARFSFAAACPVQLEEQEKHVNKVRKRLLKESAHWFTLGMAAI
jgi:hypothetical protein